METGIWNPQLETQNPNNYWLFDIQWSCTQECPLASNNLPVFKCIKDWGLLRFFRNPPTTNHKPWPFEPVKVKSCFLRGPLRWLTAAKKSVGFWTSEFACLSKGQQRNANNIEPTFLLAGHKFINFSKIFASSVTKP